LKLGDYVTGLAGSKVEVVSKMEGFIKYNEKKQSLDFHRESAKDSGVYIIKIKITSGGAKDKKRFLLAENTEKIKIQIVFTQPICSI
jgi:hypothetical protein